MRTILAIALASAAVFPRMNPAAATPKSHAEAEEFAFGGVGVAGIESDGEKFFRDVLQQGDALITFKKILGNGAPAAKLYALCGIRLLSEKDFDAAAGPLLESKETVTTMGGCILSKQRVADVAHRISDGSYDTALRNPTRWPDQK